MGGSDNGASDQLPAVSSQLSAIRYPSIGTSRRYLQRSRAAPCEQSTPTL